MRVPASSSSASARRLRPRARLAGRSLLVGAVGVALAAALGLAFAGSPARLAEGVRVAGVDVGGLTPRDAERLLERRAARLASVPVTFVAGSERLRLTAGQLGVEADWAAGVAAARRQGEGFGPVRGLRRLQTRVFGADVSPPVLVSEPVLRYAVARLARGVARPPRDAAIVLRGLRPELVPARGGATLDRRRAEGAIVRALASLSRAGPVVLPVRFERPHVTAAELLPVLADVRVALSAPVRLRLGPTRWRLARWRVAELLDLPGGGSRTLAVGGPGADRFLARLRRVVERPGRDARFVAGADGRVSVVPARAGRRLDAKATAEALLAAAVSPRRRLAPVAVATVRPRLTTAEARALGITRVLATYSTPYSGSADRIQNLRLAVSLLDGAVVPAGGTFSLNDRVGERTVERGFRTAPVIMNGEYEEAVGGGVSQVATTVFNAAWEAGLEIVERVPHSLYISRYPLGRDATVNYPDLDLKFRNDTGRPLLVRGFAGESGISVGLWGSPTGRRVVSAAGPLVVTGAVPVRTIRDASLAIGTVEVEEEGAPPRSVTATRTVYDRRGRVVHRETWHTAYRGEARVIRVGTKPKPKPQPKEEQKPKRGGGDAPEPDGDEETEKQSRKRGRQRPEPPAEQPPPAPTTTPP